MIITVLLLACTLTLDTLGVAISYGMKDIKLPFSAKIIIMLISIVSCGLSILLGIYFYDTFPMGVTKSLGIILLCFIGISIIWQGMLSNSSEQCQEEKTMLNMVLKPLGITIRIIKNPLVYDINHSSKIEKGEAIMLGLALSVDSTGIGLASALTGVSHYMMPVFLGILQLVFLYLGLYLGRTLHNSNIMNKRIISVLPGFLILAIALMRMI